MGTGPTETVSISPKWLEEIKVAEADRHEAECEKLEAEFNGATVDPIVPHLSGRMTDDDFDVYIRALRKEVDAEHFGAVSVPMPTEIAKMADICAEKAGQSLTDWLARMIWDARMKCLTK
jgi:hypothetical protein